MFDFLLRNLVKALLWLRYRVRVRGLDEIAARGRRGILFLPNHPALIDPVIVSTYLNRTFHPRPLADADQVNRPFIRWLAARLRVLPIPDLTKYGPAVREQMAAAIGRCRDALAQGDNLLMYPSGHIYRGRLEDLRGNSGVETLLRELPDVRVVLVRTTGLWGSRFSMAAGDVPHVGQVLRFGLRKLLANLLFFGPRREVLIELAEPADLPRSAARAELNEFLERFYNASAPPNTYVPYTLWEGGGPREMPEPRFAAAAGDLSAVPAGVRQRVTEFVKKLAKVDALRDEDKLAQDLGLDSLARAELLVWLGEEFGFQSADVDSLLTVGDVLLAACGQSIQSRIAPLGSISQKWFEAGRTPRRMQAAAGATVAEAFLNAARAAPGRAVVADQLGGVKTYRDLVTALLVLRPIVAGLPGQSVAIMLPASVTADVLYLAALFAGKTPVMMNWTTGVRNMQHALELTGAERILTARGLVDRVQAQGTDLSPLRSRLVLLEEVGASISRWTKLGAFLRSWIDWSPLTRAQIPPTAAVLLTSGSETLPKAVPLTHANILTNIRCVLDLIELRAADAMLGFLPPFHSFGLTVTTIAPLVSGLRCVYHANPTETWMLARLIDAYDATLLVGTPTFLAGLLRTAAPEQLTSLRFIVTGAEKCPERVYEALGKAVPGAVILEGYGVTECSPIVAANLPGHVRHGTIGRVLPIFEYAIIDVDSGQRVRRGEAGMLLVRGPCVFDGYLGRDVASPFVEFEGKSWYRTGDLVVEDADGVLTFRGRLKRFVKLGGEMISLPAIEAVLEKHYALETDDGPVLAVEATADENHPELVLFTKRPIDRQEANRRIRDAGLSPLHNVARVERVDALPLLGTGKTDYRALQARLREAASKA